jgi:hypothetical protein
MEGRSSPDSIDTIRTLTTERRQNRKGTSEIPGGNDPPERPEQILLLFVD